MDVTPSQKTDGPATAADGPRVLPYTAIVGQRRLRQALELAYVNPAVGGVLITGPRGTAKSTAVRAFAVMLAGLLPVTLPLGTTEDRIVGGWDVERVLGGEPRHLDGLLKQASDSPSQILYVDEVNLLDDHLVDLLLDAASSGILHTEREGMTSVKNVDFTLIGTMNPDEGGLRPQLLDRFGLVVSAAEQSGDAEREQIIMSAMLFEGSRWDPASGFMQENAAEAARIRERLLAARRKLPEVSFSTDIVARCARLAVRLDVVGHRGPLALLNAARARAALDQLDAERPSVRPEDLCDVAELALVHRRAKNPSSTMPEWTAADQKSVLDVLEG